MHRCRERGVATLCPSRLSGGRPPIGSDMKPVPLIMGLLMAIKMWDDTRFGHQANGIKK